MENKQLLMAPNYPILDYDPETNAILNPHGKSLHTGTIRRCILCFFQDVINSLKQEDKLKQVGELRSEIGLNPIYMLEYEGSPLLVVHPGVGAPLAAGFLEELISAGATKFVACGGCGVLDEKIAAGNALIIQSAVRDEGTSYHYLPPAQDVSAGVKATKALKQALKNQGIPFKIVKSWTTDGLYRETEARRALRIEQGCSVVEMEAAAFFAVAQFRGVELGQIVYGGDLVIPKGWDHRGWDRMSDNRTALFWLAVEACSHL